MIIGESWAYGHLPKTGGDAAAIYLARLVPGCLCDSVSDPRKHEPFWVRRESHGKAFYLLGIRRLPDWTWSLMHEINVHQALLNLYGIRDARSKAFALSRPFADEYLLSLSQGVRITHWIRQECLLGDLVDFVRTRIREIAPAEWAALRRLPTKRGRKQGNPFTESETAELRRRNPHWAEVERQVYA